MGFILLVSHLLLLYSFNGQVDAQTPQCGPNTSGLATLRKHVTGPQAFCKFWLSVPDRRTSPFSDMSVASITAVLPYATRGALCAYNDRTIADFRNALDDEYRFCTWWADPLELRTRSPFVNLNVVQISSICSCATATAIFPVPVTRTSKVRPSINPTASGPTDTITGSTIVSPSTTASASSSSRSSSSPSARSSASAGVSAGISLSASLAISASLSTSSRSTTSSSSVRVSVSAGASASVAASASPAASAALTGALATTTPRVDLPLTITDAPPSPGTSEGVSLSESRGPEISDTSTSAGESPTPGSSAQSTISTASTVSFEAGATATLQPFVPPNVNRAALDNLIPAVNPPVYFAASANDTNSSAPELEVTYRFNSPVINLDYSSRVEVQCDGNVTTLNFSDADAYFRARNEWIQQGRVALLSTERACYEPQTLSGLSKRQISIYDDIAQMLQADPGLLAVYASMATALFNQFQFTMTFPPVPWAPAPVVSDEINVQIRTTPLYGGSRSSDNYGYYTDTKLSSWYAGTINAGVWGYAVPLVEYAPQSTDPSITVRGGKAYAFFQNLLSLLRNYLIGTNLSNKWGMFCVDCSVTANAPVRGSVTLTSSKTIEYTLVMDRSSFSAHIGIGISALIPYSATFDQSFMYINMPAFNVPSTLAFTPFLAFNLTAAIATSNIGQMLLTQDTVYNFDFTSISNRGTKPGSVSNFPETQVTSAVQLWGDISIDGTARFAIPMQLGFRFEMAGRSTEVMLASNPRYDISAVADCDANSLGCAGTFTGNFGKQDVASFSFQPVPLASTSRALPRQTYGVRLPGAASSSSSPSRSGSSSAVSVTSSSSRSVSPVASSPTSTPVASTSTTITTSRSSTSSAVLPCVAGRTYRSASGQLWFIDAVTDYRTGFGTVTVTSSLNACIDYCASLGAGCVGLVWVERGQAQQYCYPKGDLVNVLPMPLSITAYGVKRVSGVAC